MKSKNVDVKIRTAYNTVNMKMNEENENSKFVAKFN